MNFFSVKILDDSEFYFNPQREISLRKRYCGFCSKCDYVAPAIQNQIGGSFMKKTNLIVFAIGVLIFTGCSKDDGNAAVDKDGLCTEATV